jgi:hypothetical protein
VLHYLIGSTLTRSFRGVRELETSIGCQLKPFGHFLPHGDSPLYRVLRACEPFFARSLRGFASNLSFSSAKRWPEIGRNFQVSCDVRAPVRDASLDRPRKLRPNAPKTAVCIMVRLRSAFLRFLSRRILRRRTNSFALGIWQTRAVGRFRPNGRIREIEGTDGAFRIPGFGRSEEERNLALQGHPPPLLAAIFAFRLRLRWFRRVTSRRLLLESPHVETHLGDDG